MRDRIGDENKMRDRIKSKDYFDQLCEDLNDDIYFYEEKLNSKELSQDRIQSVKWNLRQTYLQLIIANYSAGTEIKEIKKSFTALIQTLEENWSDGDSVVTMYWIYSIAILLNLGIENITKIQNTIDKFSIKDDALLNFYKNFIFRDEIKITGDFIPEEPYPLLKEIILSDSKKVLLISYLKKWYKGKANKCSCWYDSHKSKTNTYFGYWSFEAGAVAKILGIEDSELKNEPYYPYDLVHFEE